jgi:predicted lipoprotein with Yx(FWY)xxD motif
VCSSPGAQLGPQAVSDGNGGVFVGWRDDRTTFGDVYAQRLDTQGIRLWAAAGLGVCTLTSGQGPPVIAADGAGGVFLAWTDTRQPQTGGLGDIFVQRVTGLGVPLWAANGVAVCTAAQPQVPTAVTTDGNQGAIVVWEDNRSASCLSPDIYARRINAAGTPQWTADGVPLCVVQGDQVSPQIVADGAGGATVVWSDKRFEVRDLYAQRVDANGLPIWTANGALLSDAPDRQMDVDALSLGPNGIWLAWNDLRTGSPTPYVQRVGLDGSKACSPLGDPLGLPNSTPSQTRVGALYAPDMVADGAGIFLAYTINGDIYVQRSATCGVPSWGAAGTLVCGAFGEQVYPRVVADGQGGAIVLWRDQRAGAEGIYAQRVNAAGVPQWLANGVPLCLVNSEKHNISAVTDGFGGAIAVWMDGRSGIEAVYAQRVSASGQVAPVVSADGPPMPRLHLGPPRPNPASSTIAFDLELPGASSVSIRVFDAAGRLVRTLIDRSDLEAGPHVFQWDGTDGQQRRVSSGRYMVQVELGGGETRSEQVVLVH